MSDIKWIKMSTNMPENRKIKKIRRLPDGNNIILFWVFLLSKAGESNQGGGLYFLEDMPYTVEDLADEFDFTYDFVKFALITLEKMQMVEMYDEIIYIKNWEKYQSVDQLEKIREQTRKRVSRHRQSKKVLLEPKCNVTGNGDVTESNATDIELELDIDKEIPYVEIINYLNDASGKKYKDTTDKTKRCIKARVNEGFTIDDFKKVIDKKVTDWKGTDMAKYIRPETLFGNKFEGYLNEEIKSNNDNTIDWDEL